MAKKIIKLDEKSLNSIIKESTMMVLKEWEDLGDESYRDLNIYDCVHNLNVNSAKAENDEKNGSHIDCSAFINCSFFYICR